MNIKQIEAIVLLIQRFENIRLVQHKYDTYAGFDHNILTCMLALFKNYQQQIQSQNMYIFYLFFFIILTSDSLNLNDKYLRVKICSYIHGYLIS